MRKDRSKARRRRQDLLRMKNKARRIYPHDGQAALANHLAVCSGPCCGNPRRHFGEPTIQEKRFLEKARGEETAALVEMNLR
jgi:hypothetical protein